MRIDFGACARAIAGTINIVLREPLRQRTDRIPPGRVAAAESEQDVLQQAADHARTAHQVNEVTPELADKVRSAIRDEAA